MRRPMTQDKPFAGVRVVELAQWVFVPVAGALLAAWGADVIHIEPTRGDPYRGLATQGIGSERQGVNLSMALANAGRSSLALNVQHDDGRAVLHRLLESADVLLTNLRPGALERLGLDAESVAERYPHLVFARGHGYGVRGPDADRAGYDASAFWARGGLANILTPPDRDYPISQRGAMGDRNGAMSLAFGVAAALLKRERTGHGLRCRRLVARDRDVDVVLRRARRARWRRTGRPERARTAGEPPRGHVPDQGRTAHPARVPRGRPLLGGLLPADRARRLGRRRPLRRYRDRAAPTAPSAWPSSTRSSPKRTFDEWKSLLSQLDAPWAPVQSVAEILDDPQVVANGYIAEVADGEPTYRLPAVPVQFDERPPDLRPRPRTQRAHRDAAARARLRLGRHRGAQGRRGRPVTRPHARFRYRTRSPHRSGRRRPATSSPWPGARAAAPSPIRPMPCAGHCGSADPGFDFVEVDGAGTVRSWTVMRQSFLPGFDDDVPFVLVDVELAAAPDIRLIGRLLDGPAAPLRAGAAGDAGVRGPRSRSVGAGVRARARRGGLSATDLRGPQPGGHRRLRAEPRHAPRRVLARRPHPRDGAPGHRRRRVEGRRRSTGSSRPAFFPLRARTRSSDGIEPRVGQLAGRALGCQSSVRRRVPGHGPDSRRSGHGGQRCGERRRRLRARAPRAPQSPGQLPRQPDDRSAGGSTVDRTARFLRSGRHDRIGLQRVPATLRRRARGHGRWSSKRPARTAPASRGRTGTRSR